MHRGSLCDVIDSLNRNAAVAFGKRLRKARTERGLSSSQLADKLGLNRSAIAQYEAGRSLPSVTVLQKIARLLGITTDRLCFEEYELKDAIQDKELAIYFAKADRLQHRYRSLVMEFIESLVAREEVEEMKRAARQSQKAA